MKTLILFASAFLACATSANAADNKLNLTSEFTKYSNDFGKRNETSAEFSSDLGRTAITLSASRAKRKFETGSFKAVELSGTMYRDWSDRFYTRTQLAVSSNKPVYASRQVANDFNLKLLPRTVFTVGGKYARYYGDRDVYSWSAGGTWHFGGGFVSYRFSAHDVDKLGNSHSHLASFRLKDPRGSGQTQLWLGTGTSLHEQEVLLSGKRGDYRSISVQRVQPITDKLAVNLVVGRTWYDTGATDYRGTTASLGLNVKGWSIF